MVDVECAFLAGILVRFPESFRLGPGLEGGLALPNGVRGVEHTVIVLGALEKMELDEARHLVKMGVAAHPYLLESLLGALLHAKSIHGDEHDLAPAARAGRQEHG